MDKAVDIVDKAVDMVYKVVVMVEVGQELVHLHLLVHLLDHLQVVILDNKLVISQIMDIMEATVVIQEVEEHKLQKLLKL